MAYYFTSKIRKSIGIRIKKIRKSKKLKQVDIAVDAGLNPSYYGKIERGMVNPSIEKLYGIIRALHIKSSVFYLFSPFKIGIQVKSKGKQINRRRF